MRTNAPPEVLRVRFAALYDKNAPAAARRAALSSLRSRAHLLYKTGVPHEHNHAVAALRELGLGGYLELYPQLTALGLRDLDVHVAQGNWRRTADTFLAFTRKPLRDVTAADVERFLARPERRTRPDGWDNERAWLFHFFEACTRKGLLK